MNQFEHETWKEKYQKVKVVPGTNDTGRAINRIFSTYNENKDDKLNRRGNVLCLFYSPFEKMFGPPTGK